MTTGVRRIGLTGGIASGKSLVGSALQGHGALVIDADKVYHQLLDHDATLVALLIETFGTAIAPTGKIDRQLLASRVMADHTALRLLGTMTHPVIMTAINTQLAMATWPDTVPRIAVVEAALLIEGGWVDSFDALLLVTAPLDRRLAWLMARNNLSLAQATARIAAQLDDEARRQLATWELRNDGDPTHLAHAVDALWPRLAGHPWPP